MAIALGAVLASGSGCRKLAPLSVFGIEGVTVELIHVERQVHEHRHYYGTETDKAKERDREDAKTDDGVGRGGNVGGNAGGLPAGNPFGAGG